MAITFANVISNARVIYSDAVSPYRIEDATLLSFAKDGIVEIATLDPSQFEVKGTINCIAGQCLQQLPNPERAIYLIDVYESVVAGNRKAIYECDLETLRRYRPTYTTDTAAQADNWMRQPSREGEKRDETRLLVYPQAPSGQALYASWTEYPDMTAYAVGDTIPVSEDYAVALEWYIAFRAEQLNDEAQVRQRAAENYAKFIGLMGQGKTDRSA